MSTRNTFSGPMLSNFYGDEPIRWFVGVVIEKANDEPKLGRVKVRIPGVHGPDVGNADLPYAQLLIPTTEAGTSGLGWNSALEPTATVFGIFLDGKQSQLPLVMGSIPVVHMASKTQIANGVAWSNDGSPGVGTPPNATSALAGPPASFIVDPNVEYGGNLQYAYQYFKKTGAFTEIAIAALLGNFLKESGGTVDGKYDIRPVAEGDKDLKRKGDRSLGIAQWYGPSTRQDNFFKFAKDKGLSYEALELQVQFVVHEWQTVGEYNLGRLNNYKTIGPATVYVHHHYENPEDTSARSAFPAETREKRGVAKLGEADRIKDAKNVHATFTRKAKEAPVADTPPTTTGGPQ